MSGKFSPTLTQLELAALTNNVSAASTFGRVANTEVLLLDRNVLSGIYGFLVLNISALNPQQQIVAAASSSPLQVWVIIVPIIVFLLIVTVVIVVVQRRFAAVLVMRGDSRLA